MTTQENKKPTYFDALKIWNEGREGKRLVPKKGTPEYDEVCIIFKDLKLSHVPEAPAVDLDVSVAPVKKVRIQNAKKKSIVAEPIVEPVMEPVVEPVVEKVKKPRKPRAKKVKAEVEEEPSL